MELLCNDESIMISTSTQVGENYGILSKAEQSRFSSLGCRNVVNSKSFSCDDERGDSLIREWRNNEVNGLCENNAESKINCFDSPLGPRYCEFENVLVRLQDEHSFIHFLSEGSQCLF